VKNFYDIVYECLNKFVLKRLDHKMNSNKKISSISPEVIIKPLLDVLGDPEEKIKQFGQFITHQLEIFKYRKKLSLSTKPPSLGGIIKQCVENLENARKKQIMTYMKESQKKKEVQPLPQQIIDDLKTLSDYPLILKNN